MQAISHIALFIDKITKKKKYEGMTPCIVTFSPHQGKAKWDAWNEKKGLSADEAKQKYIEQGNKLKEKHGVSS